MQKGIVLLLLLILLVIPVDAEASHTSYYGRVDTSDLDDDPVKKVPIPVLFGVELDDVVPDFGAPRGGGTRSHEGQDFMVPLGTPIVSPTEAIVITTGEGVSAGKFVYTANPGGEVFRYMHLDHIADLDRGDELDVGDFIGTVGDTGNAPAGAYHLHFEMRDDENDAMDPYPRLGEGFTLKEKVSFLKGIINDYKRSQRDEYAELLVDTFRSELTAAYEKGYDLPRQVEDALEDAGVDRTIELRAQLDKLIASIPKLLTMELELGDQGTAVSLLQFFIIYTGEGKARDRLAASGATGYFGPITESALKEYQEFADLMPTGIYADATRDEMLAYGK